MRDSNIMNFRSNMSESAKTLLAPTVLYEDSDVLVVDKPSGLAVHGRGADSSGTLVAWLLDYAPEARDVGEPRIGSNGQVIERSGIVHRLDRETSGVMILAKNQSAFDQLKQQFRARLVKKLYRAIAYGRMKESWGTIARPIGRSAKDFRRRSAERGAKGTIRDAVTDWECLGTGEYEGQVFSYLTLRPQTGRMHQLRVHLKAISHPIVGDVLYAGKRLKLSNNAGLNRLALHAHELELQLPKGAHRRFVAPLAAELITAVDQIMS